MDRLMISVMSYRETFGLLAFLCFVFCIPLKAQREQAHARYEHLGSRSIPGSRGIEGSSVGQSTLYLGGGFQNMLDSDGSTVLTSSFNYRRTFLDFNGLPNANFTAELNFLAYEGTLLRTISDRFQAIINIRAGVFTDGRDVDGKHLRIEPAGILDFFVNDNLVLGLGYVYNTSNLGRLISVPLIHVLYIGGSEFMIDGIIPSKIDFWYLPSKDWEFGISAGLYGSQYRTGNREFLREAFNDQARQLVDNIFYANALVGPVARYRIGGNTFVGLEGGYTFIRRLIAGTSDKKTVQDFTPNATYFLRAGLSLSY